MSRFVEEEVTAVVVHLQGPATITIALRALVRVLGPRFVVVERGHFRRDGARLATPEAGMVAGEGQGVTLCVPVGHVLGRTLGQGQGLAPCHIRVLQDIHGARVGLSPTAEEGELGAEAEMIFGTAGQGRRSSGYTNFCCFAKMRFSGLCLMFIRCLFPNFQFSISETVPWDVLDPIQLFI